MQEDIQKSALYAEAEALFNSLRRPGTAQVSDATEIDVSPSGKHAVFTGTILDKLEGDMPTRVCRVDLSSGETRVLTYGPSMDRLPKYSPSGEHIAFVSDRSKAGDYQLYLLDPLNAAVRVTPVVDGWVEYLHWSPDGTQILLGVAAYGADISGGQGAIASMQLDRGLPSWMPSVESGGQGQRWRSAWVYDLSTDCVHQVSDGRTNVWEAAWCGNEMLVAVVSPAAGEGFWYSARLALIHVQTTESREIYRPEDQLGWPSASPSGKYLAVVEAVCSDRCIVVGDLRVIQTGSGEVKRVDTRGVDIAFTEWRSEWRLLLAGHRGFETVVGLYDVTSGTFSEVWTSREVTTGGRCVTVSGISTTGDCALVGESFLRAPEIAVIRQGEYQTVKSFDLGYADHIRAIKSVERVAWSAPDGLEIEGWLLEPRREGPYALVTNIHGGPVWHWRQTWLGRPRTTVVLMLVSHGYGVFLPNPRGSSGRGQNFAAKVKGDINGADSYDLLSGLDLLVQKGAADPTRLGVMGISYGGGMTSWLITQDARFAAAVPVAPHTNQVSEHLISNIPHFVEMFVGDKYTNPNGRYFTRSPVMHAHKARTPTLNICGALDRCTPPEEAVQFHNALVENGIESVLVTYPEEGHGISKFPAAVDFTARVVDWFQMHMPAAPAQNRTDR